MLTINRPKAQAVFELKDGTRVTESMQHPGLFIFNYPSGGFSTLTSSAQEMKKHLKGRLYGTEEKAAD